ncbi:hypothetical protein Gotur_008277 [Gossypium turneri]
MKLHCSLGLALGFPAQLRWKAKKASFQGGQSHE